jgi:hypothetical protein
MEEKDGVTLISLTTVAPDPLTEELPRQGFQVYEVRAISEVFSLVEQPPTITIAISAAENVIP